MTNLDSILKSRDITLPTKVHLVKAMVFPVVMYGCESWTRKKAEHWRIDAFELWCWRRLLRVPWTARRSNQSILKEISPGCSLEGLMLKLKPQYSGHLMRRADSLEKTLMLFIPLGTAFYQRSHIFFCTKYYNPVICANVSSVLEYVLPLFLVLLSSSGACLSLVFLFFSAQWIPLWKLPWTWYVRWWISVLAPIWDGEWDRHSFHLFLWQHLHQ